VDLRLDQQKATAVTAKVGSTCTADIGGVETSVQVARDLSVAAGDALLVCRAGATWVAIARLQTAAPASIVAPTVPPKPAPPTTRGRLVITPVETRSRQGSKWRTDTDDVYQGQYGGNGNHVGCAFYGRKAATIANATVLSASVRVRRPDRGGSNAATPTTMRLITERFRPSGAPTLTSSTSGPSLRRGATGTFSVPDAWAQAMMDGTAGGLAVYDASGSPYVILAGRGTWSPAWTLTIDWRR
jgi:hypothetical protein